MECVKVIAGFKEYNIEIDNDLLKSIKICNRYVVISDENVYELYGKYFNNANFIVIKPGEQSKSIKNLEYIYQELMKYKINREDYIFALGGGVVGDIAGFAASTFKRGINFIQIPTTLLAQVDSSVGGKVAVNISQGKNMVGAFYQPQKVYADIATLNTLNKREISAGMAEVIKYGYIADKNFIANIKKMSFIEIVKRSCEIKADFVKADPYDLGERMKLNYGHTIGHAIETVTEYKEYLHGEGVAIGMVYAAKIAEKLGVAQEGLYLHTKEIVEFFGLPTDVEKSVLVNSIDILMNDKKAEKGIINFILIEETGKSVIKKIDVKTIKEALEI